MATHAELVNILGRDTVEMFDDMFDHTPPKLVNIQAEYANRLTQISNEYEHEANDV